MSKCKPTTLFLRKAVTAALDRIWQSPLTVIEAPMGYGKTTAVRAYLEKSAACVLWKTLETDSVSSFWQGFVRLWEKLDIDCARRLSQLGFPESPRFVEEAVRLMEMPALTVPTVIVIDDYHLLCSPEVDWLLESLIKTEIPNLHLVIMSRVIFGENANELALKGYCNLIGKQHFELTKPEIIEYYKNCGVQLKPKEVDELLAYTEGWISALYLCLLNYLQQGKIEKPASLQQLLDKVVYQQCSDNAKELLLLLSIFDSFSLAQAEFLWTNGSAEKLLRELLRKNAFISFDPLNQTYQLHNILTSYLRSLFDKKSLPQKQAIWSVEILFSPALAGARDRPGFFRSRYRPLCPPAFGRPAARPAGLWTGCPPSDSALFSALWPGLSLFAQVHFLQYSIRLVCSPSEEKAA